MTRLFSKGDRVYVDPAFDGAAAGVLGRVFVVDKVNPKNVRCHAEDGGRGINYPKEALKLYEGGEVPVGRPFVPIADTEFFSAGEIVTLKRAYKDWTAETPLVVLVDKVNKVNVTLLGGDGDRYLRCPREGLVKRDLDWLAEALIS